jgi:ATP-dependent Lon protease
LDTVLELPWNTKTSDSTDINAAREVLDADHHGLDDVKDRIVEYLAIRARRAERGLEVIGGRGSGAVMALVGPPGVGKTSLGESVARALGRKFVRLDPAQNHTFRDHYLEVDLDLSDVLFLATANVVETIPQALLDRMELVNLDGYTEDDKIVIARQFLLPRQLERAALTAAEVTVSDDALREVAANYTREPGVRQMERLLAKVLRKAATKLAHGTAEPGLVIEASNLREYLGRPRFTPEAHERTSIPGVATGLAVTGLGGDVLFVEASALEGASPGSGSGGLTLTGQLGEVMKESAQIALSYVRAHADQLGITDPSILDRPIHIHVPAGAVPKDGPSAGVTMVTALTSMALGRPVRSEVGMTGEVTLNGRVLPIGGVKQKLLAAQRAGLGTVFVPKRNEPDLDDVPGDVLETITVVPTTDVAELVAQAIESIAAGHDSRVAA